MDVQGIIEWVVGLMGSASPFVALVLFALCAIGEFGLSIPYLLETVWLLAGYEVSKGQLSPFTLALLIAATIAGRELGTIVLYRLSRYGTMPLIKFYHRRFEKKMADKEGLPQKIARGLSNLSPFTVAAARLMWLRIPITLALGAQRQLKPLVVGALLAAVAWDGAYIILGATVGAAVIANPVTMVLIAVVGLSLVYGATYGVRRIRKYMAARKQEG